MMTPAKSQFYIEMEIVGSLLELLVFTFGRCENIIASTLPTYLIAFKEGTYTKGTDVFLV